MVKILVCFLFLLGISQPQDLINGSSKSAAHPAKTFKVLVFLGVDCPISQDYIGTLNKLHDQYFEKGEMTGIVPQPRDDKEVIDFKTAYQVKFDLIADKKLAFVKKYNVHVTPEIVLLDMDGKVRYQGAIDNWYYELGKHRQVANEHYLLNAIDELIAGKEVSKPKTEPIGCVISTSHNHH